LRFWTPHLVLAALVLVVILFAVSSMDAEATRYLVTDSFNGPNGSDPDTNKWVVEESGNQDIVQISGESLMTWSTNSGHAYCTMARPFSDDNITLTLEFIVAIRADRCVDIAFITGDGQDWDRLLTVKFESDQWVWSRMWEGEEQRHLTGNGVLDTNTPYVAELDIYMGYASFSVREAGEATNVWFFNDLQLEPTKSRNLITFGVDAFIPGASPKTYWENLTLVDPVAPPNAPPLWRPIIRLNATEDELFSHNFGKYIMDEQELWEISLTSPSDFVVAIRYLQVDFLFPEGERLRSVTLIAYDGYASTPYQVSFHVEPVNDPPEHVLPDTFNVPEGVPTDVDLSLYIWDVDNDMGDIQLIVDSDYVQVEGLKLLVEFPEDMSMHSIDLGISDGTYTTWAYVTFLISPVNNPPELLPIADVTIAEDIPYPLDLAPLVSDPDDYDYDLTVTVSTNNCTIDDLLLTFLYPLGGFEETVIVRVSDGFGMDERSFRVRVLAVNDPPVIGDIPLQEIDEDEEVVIFLENWISDEEDGDEQLVIGSEDEHVIHAEDLVLVVFYPHGGLEDDIGFWVSDGENEVNGTVRVRVLDINDRPRMEGIGDLTGPYDFSLPSGSRREYPLYASDADDVNLHFSVDATWDGFSIAGSELIIEAGRWDEGSYVGYVSVHDHRGGSHRVKVTATVVPRSHLPVEVHITSPVNNSVYEPGHEVLFDVRVLDPEGYLGDDVTVTWTSDEIGNLAVMELEEGTSVLVSELPEGQHTVFVTVSDGDLAITHWVYVQIGDAEEGSTEDAYGLICAGGVTVLVIIIIMGIVIGIAISRDGGEGEPEHVVEEPRVVAGGPAGTTDRDYRMMRERAAEVRREAAARERERAEAARAAQEEEAREARLREQRLAEELRKAASERRFMAPEPPGSDVFEPVEEEAVPVPEATAPTAAGMPLPTEDDMQRQKAQLVRALGALPGGLPPSLSLYDAPTIANRIIKGRKKRAKDGRLLAFVQGEWYYADPGDRDFMRAVEG
jgi:hypothetical protein